VNSHYITSIREAASVPELHGYLRRKYQWSKETLRTINWKWFKAAVSTYHHTDNHLMKLVYGHLPTRHVKGKKTGQSWIPDTCRYCEIEPETFDHLLKCNHTAGLEFRKALPRSVRTYCQQRKVPHNFQVTLITALEDWIRDKSPLQKVTNRPNVRTLAAAQSRIGWSRFLKGFLAEQWHEYLRHELDASPDHAQNATDLNSDSFFAGLIKTMWTQQSHFWISHQQALHNPPIPTQDPDALQELRLEIQHLHGLKGQVLAQHRDTYFHDNLTRNQLIQTLHI
jgi:hypothetical protein